MESSPAHISQKASRSLHIAVEFRNATIWRRLEIGARRIREGVKEVYGHKIKLFEEQKNLKT